MSEMKDRKKNDQNLKATAGGAECRGQYLSPWKVLLSHMICGAGLALSLWLANNVYSINLIDNPAPTLRLLSVIEVAVVIMLYSLFRKNSNHCSYVKAVARGLLGLPVGAVINAIGAIVLGAPVGTQYFIKTLYWSLLMSSFTFAPAASVYGASWVDLHRIFAHTKPIDSIDFMICLPAHGAVIGAWFGAWPMPLDWERTWQEWPICVTYGAIIGYLVGMLVSFGFALFHGSRQHMKAD